MALEPGLQVGGVSLLGELGFDYTYKLCAHKTPMSVVVGAGSDDS